MFEMMKISDNEIYERDSFGRSAAGGGVGR